ncbi:type IV pilin protein [Argonema galeatum]|uniref:type IV pilin protein n=1 Tax=Argonema galeatum TaxID=2942762 RepID=UPI002011DFB5|nr:type IV pilin-like G/H family protein [Argonema galeatum]MCL1466172.1 prepilin-type N-terminal cleavage/methylation domain-containing protein [Argonema galeatum A003/A1]
MNNFKNEFLRYSYLKNREQGFTLVELLVVIFIISVLAGIALPSLLKFVNKAKGVEATVNIKNSTDAQKAYYSENLVFTDSLSNLNNSSVETENYQYSILLLNRGQIAIHIAIPKKPDIPYYGEGVYFKNTINSPKIEACSPFSSSYPTVFEVVALVRSSCQF